MDVHAVTFDADGRGTHQMEEGGECLSPAAQVLCHTQGYEPTEKDLRDMTMLHDRFGVELPPSLRLTAIEP